MSHNKLSFYQSSDEMSYSDHDSFFQNAPIGAFRTTLQGTYVFANPTLARMYGYESPRHMMDEVTDIGAQLYVDRRDREEFLRLLHERGYVENYESRQVRRDGTIFWSSRNAWIVHDEDGNVYCQGFTSDITEHKQVEMAFRKSEERFRKIIEDISNIAVQGYDEERRVTFWNKASEDLYGYSKEEALGKKIENLIIPSYMADEVKRLHHRWVEYGETIPAEELDLVDKDGNTVPVFSSHTMHETSQGKEMFCLDVDLRPTKEYENILKMQKNLLNSILDSIHDVLAIQYPDHTIDRCNKYGYDMFGLSPEQAKGKKCYELLGRSRQCEICPTDKAISQRETVEIDKYTPEMGRHLNCRSHPVFDEDGNIIRVIEHLRDITDQRNLETKLMRKKDELESIVLNVPGIIFSCFFDDQRTMVYMSSHDAKSITGYPYTDFINNNVCTYKSIMHPDDVKMVDKHVFNCVRANTPWEIQYRIICKDGSIKWVYEKGRPVIDNAGFVSCLNGIIQDVSEHVALEKEAKEKDILLENVVNNSGGFLWHKDENHRYKFCDKNFKKKFFGLDNNPEITGYNDVELVELYKKRDNVRHDFGDLCLSTDDHSRQKGEKCKYIEGGFIDSSLFVLEVIKTPLFDDNNEYIGNIGLAWDRSEEFEILSNGLACLVQNKEAVSLLDTDWNSSPFVYYVKK